MLIPLTCLSDLLITHQWREGDGRGGWRWTVLKTKPHAASWRREGAGETQLHPWFPFGSLANFYSSFRIPGSLLCLHPMRSNQGLLPHASWDLFPTQLSWGRASRRAEVTAWFEVGANSSVRSEKKAGWEWGGRVFPPHSCTPVPVLFPL